MPTPEESVFTKFQKIVMNTDDSLEEVSKVAALLVNVLRLIVFFQYIVDDTNKENMS